MMTMMAPTLSAPEAAGSTAFVNDFADCAHTVRQVEELLQALGSVGVLLEVDGDLLKVSPPPEGMRRELLDRIRAHKAGILAVLRSAKAVAAVDLQGFDSVHAARDGGSNVLSPYAGPASRTNEATGVQREARGHSTRITQQGVSARADKASREMIVLPPEMIWVCDTCNDLCDTLTAADEWACSRCDPRAEERRQRTLRILKLRQDILAYQAQKERLLQRQRSDWR